MLTLYYKPSCPYSQRVLAEAEKHNITFDLKDISGDTVLRDELIERGGKKQVPYLVDTEHDISMYESADIVAHLNQYHASTATAAATDTPRVHVYRTDAGTCDVCE